MSSPLDFWLKSWMFWAFLVPIHVALFGIAVWSRGLFVGAIVTLVLFVLSALGVLVVEMASVWLIGPDIPDQGSFRSRALRTWAPWPLGLLLGYLPLLAWIKYSERGWGRRSRREA